MIFAALAGVLFFMSASHALKKKKILRAGKAFVSALLLFLVALSAGLIRLANHGYHTLIREECAAVVSVQSIGKQQFKTHIVFPDSSVKEFECSGDQLYIDAHILKWHPLLNVIGIHTTYELDRIGGRYIAFEEERSRPRTVHSLSPNRVLNMFDLSKKWSILHPIVDAAYGSATFVDTDASGVFDIMVSTSGLLIRPHHPCPQPKK